MPAAMDVRRLFARALKPIIAALVVVYFMIDLVFASLVTPVGRWLGTFWACRRFATWLGSLGRYQSLFVFIVPLLLLEPIKPIALYLTSTGHLVAGILLMIVGEVLKILILQRLFQINREKLMSFRAFARAYDSVIRILDTLRSIPAWQSAVRWLKEIKAVARRKDAGTKGGVEPRRRATGHRAPANCKAPERRPGGLALRAPASAVSLTFRSVSQRPPSSERQRQNRTRIIKLLVLL